MEDKKVKRPVTARRRYWNFNTQLAAASALAAAAFYPFDALKTRIQLGQGSGLQVARNMAISTFYKGFSAGVLRQAALTFFASKSLKTFYVSPLIANERKRLTNNDPFPCLLSAGALGAFLSSPADLILTRMQADAALPASQRRNYLNIFHAIYRIIRDDGVLSLWKGGFPTVIRTTATTAGIYGVSHGFKALLTIFTPDMVSRVPVGYVVVGILPAALSKPFDYVKTQLQIMRPDANGKYPYTGSLDCMKKTFKSGGLRIFYAGFPAYCLTCMPQIWLTFAILGPLQAHDIAIFLKV